MITHRNRCAFGATAPAGGRWNLRRPSGEGFLRWAALLALALLLSGCASAPVGTSRPFAFDDDTFAYPNELKWVYEYDAAGNWTTKARDPEPTYSLHCFVVALAARQFYDHARFRPDLPRASDEAYTRLIRQVVKANPRKPTPDAQKTVIPGFSDLREFSRAKESLLKANCGGAWRSYCQRGHWRMILPMSRRHQADMAAQITRKLEFNRPVLVHIFRFPQLSINHALLIYSAETTGDGISFLAYDPNAPEQPLTVRFDRASRTFLLPPLKYFRGGRVDLYEVYYRWNY